MSNILDPIINLNIPLPEWFWGTVRSWGGWLSAIFGKGFLPEFFDLSIASLLLVLGIKLTIWLFKIIPTVIGAGVSAG